MRKWKEKVGDYLIDISKYVVTGVVITSLLDDFGGQGWNDYFVGLSTASIALLFGLGLINNNERKEN